MSDVRRSQYLQEYLRWLWPNRYSIAGIFALSLCGVGLNMIEPLLMRFIIDDALLRQALSPASRLRLLNISGLSLLAVIAISALVNGLRDYRQRLVNTRLMMTLRRSLFRRLVHLPLATLQEMKTGELLSRLTGDIDAATGLMQTALLLPATSVVRLLIATGMLLVMNAHLALVVLLVIPLAVLTSVMSSKRILPIYRSIRSDIERSDGYAGETFSGIRVVRAFRREMRELLKYIRRRHLVARKELFAYRRELWLWTSWGFGLAAVNVAIVWYGGRLYLAERASIGDIMAFQWFSFMLLGPVWQIVHSFSEVQRSLASLERVFEILMIPTDKPDRHNAVDAPRIVSDLEFQNVSFEYRGGCPVVTNINFKVPGGAMVALVGRSGAGKTTLTDLVARFHDPTSGRVIMNGIDIRDFRLRTYRQLLAIVQQDVFLFDGTVRDNIAFGGHGASNAEVEDAARRANAHDFIRKLPDGYSTFIGERGIKLSGGEQQRLAIARAILASPHILILDEATSSLDSESEQLIQESMAALLKGRTTFVIAHRLSTIGRADLILMIDDGQIVERGSHAELMSRRGAYWKMVTRQATNEAVDGW